MKKPDKKSAIEMSVEELKKLKKLSKDDREWLLSSYSKNLNKGFYLKKGSFESFNEFLKEILALKDKIDKFVAENDGVNLIFYLTENELDVSIHKNMSDKDLIKERIEDMNMQEKVNMSIEIVDAKTEADAIKQIERLKKKFNI